MIIAVCILSYFVVTLAAALICVCSISEFDKEEWFATVMFVICPALWLAVYKIYRIIKQRREKKRRLR